MNKEELIKQKEQEYIDYINKHRENVQKVWDKIKNNPACMDLIDKTIINMTREGIICIVDSLILNHDMSKFGKQEFDGYRKKYYPISDEEKESNDFDNAWEHHYNNNLHHWNWWYKSGNQNNMPIILVVEMICDWEAMSYYFGGTTKQWYENNKKEIYLGYSQRQFVEKMLNLL